MALITISALRELTGSEASFDDLFPVIDISKAKTDNIKLQDLIDLYTIPTASFANTSSISLISGKSFTAINVTSCSFASSASGSVFATNAYYTISSSYSKTASYASGSMVIANSSSHALTSSYRTLYDTDILKIRLKDENFNRYSAFYSSGETLDGWMLSSNSIITWSHDGSPAAPCFYIPGGNYCAIQPFKTNDIANSTIEFNVKPSTGSLSFCNFIFGADINGQGNILHLSAATESFKCGFTSSNSWTDYYSPTSGTQLVTGSWNSVKIVINDRSKASWYLNDILQEESKSVNLYGTYIALHGSAVSSSGGLFDEIKIRKNFTQNFSNSRARNGFICFTTSSNVVFSYYITSVTTNQSFELNPNKSDVYFSNLYSGNYEFVLTETSSGEKNYITKSISLSNNTDYTTHDYLFFFNKPTAQFSISSSYTQFTDFVSGSNVFAQFSNNCISSSNSISSSYSSRSDNDAKSAMIFLFAGIEKSASTSYYTCDGGTYNISNTELSSSLRTKFSNNPSFANKLPDITPFVKNVVPTNTQISESYNNLLSLGGSGSAVYYNIKI